MWYYKFRDMNLWGENMKKTLNSNWIKTIAIMAMTIDHIAWLMFPGSLQRKNQREYEACIYYPDLPDHISK